MKLIDKDYIVEELEKRKNAALMRQQNLEAIGQETVLNEMIAFELGRIISFINTLEVKKMDLDKELDYWRHTHFNGKRDKEASGEYLERDSQLDLAKYFFALGLRVPKGEQLMNLIAKDTLISEIEKLQLCTMDEHMNYYSTEAQGEYNALSKLKSFLSTLEVKEVDLEKEIAFQWEGCDCDDINLYAKVSSEQFKAIAKHFFELGLKTKG